jgi:hypothetical protein
VQLGFCFLGYPTGLSTLFLDVFQSRVQNFLDAAQLGAPEISHIVEAFVYAVAEGQEHEPVEYGVQNDRNTDSQV